MVRRSRYIQQTPGICSKSQCCYSVGLQPDLRYVLGQLSLFHIDGLVQDSNISSDLAVLHKAVEISLALYVQNYWKSDCRSSVWAIACEKGLPVSIYGKYDIVPTRLTFVQFQLSIPGPRLNIKTVLSMYGDFHVKDKTAVRTSYL